MPTTIINRRIPGLDTHNVLVDNVKGSFMAVNHLLEEGNQNIAVFAFDNPYISTWRDRLEGYQSALLARGFTEKDFYILELSQNNDLIKDEIVRYLKQNDHLDAIFSTNNMITLKIYKAAKELNFKIPEDISIVSYDETVWAEHMNPPITTIRQPGYKMGVIAAENLIHSIDENKLPHPETVVLKPEIIIRESSVR